MSFANLNKARIPSKAPDMSLTFWIKAVIATTVGVTGAGFLMSRLHMDLTQMSLMAGAVLMAVFFVQLRFKKHVEWSYLLTMAMVSLVATLITNNFTDHLNVPVVLSVALFTVAVASTFMRWYSREATLSIETIYTQRRELYYWVAILFTFALGTVTSDLLAEKMNAGYALSAIIFAGMIGLLTFSHSAWQMNPTVSFWGAFILVRAFTASCGNFLTQPFANGGLGLGLFAAGIVIFTIIFISLGYLNTRKMTATA